MATDVSRSPMQRSIISFIGLPDWRAASYSAPNVTPSSRMCSSCRRRSLTIIGPSLCSRNRQPRVG